MTRPALRGSAFCSILVPGYPGGANLIHSMRPTGTRRHRTVACAALGNNPGMALQGRALDIVVGLRAWIFRVSGAVACLASEPAVTFRETVHRQSGSRDVGLSGERLVRRYARGSLSIQGRGESNLSGIGCRCSGVAVLTIRLFQPALATGNADGRHRSMAALALYRERPVSSDGGSHRAAQTSRVGAWMAPVSGSAIRRSIQRSSGKRIDLICMKRVVRGGQRRNTRLCWCAERVGRVAGRT